MAAVAAEQKDADEELRKDNEGLDPGDPRLKVPVVKILVKILPFVVCTSCCPTICVFQLDGTLIVGAKSSVFMGCPSITPSGNSIFNDAEFMYKDCEGLVKIVVLSTGSIVHVRNYQKQVIWFESVNEITAGEPNVDPAAAAGPGPQIKRCGACRIITTIVTDF